MKLNTQIEQLYERLNGELDHFYRDARFYTVKEIMSRFGANRRVVDGALERMTGNGLIERVPNIGIFCKTDRKLREQNVVLAIYDWPSEINRLWGNLIEQKLAARRSSPVIPGRPGIAICTR